MPQRKIEVNIDAEVGDPRHEESRRAKIPEPRRARPEEEIRGKQRAECVAIGEREREGQRCVVRL